LADAKGKIRGFCVANTAGFLPEKNCSACTRPTVSMGVHIFPFAGIFLLNLFQYIDSFFLKRNEKTSVYIRRVPYLYFGGIKG
jgi:hypothetical protein